MARVYCEGSCGQEVLESVPVKDRVDGVRCFLRPRQSKAVLLATPVSMGGRITCRGGVGYRKTVAWGNFRVARTETTKS